MAEDISQEVFLKVYQAAHRLDPNRDPSAWLATVVYNTCRDLWRSRKYKAAIRSDSLEQTPGLGERLADDKGDAEEELIRAQEQERVQAAILKLPEDKRAVILLRDYAGLTHEEIASAMGLSGAAVRKRYSRGLAELAKLLKGDTR